MGTPWASLTYENRWRAEIVGGLCCDNNQMLIVLEFQKIQKKKHTERIVLESLVAIYKKKKVSVRVL